jgi:hypothetical protein
MPTSYAECRRPPRFRHQLYEAIAVEFYKAMTHHIRFRYLGVSSKRPYGYLDTRIPRKESKCSLKSAFQQPRLFSMFRRGGNGSVQVVCKVTQPVCKNIIRTPFNRLPTSATGSRQG